MPASRTARGGTRGTVFREVARIRMADAASLLASGRHSGAIYLAGYAIECHLKFAYCCRREKVYLPEHLEVHDWDRIINAAGLLPDIRQESNMDALYSTLLVEWGPMLRYRTTKYSEVEANRLYSQMDQLYVYLKELVP
jgi:hypothetical protein